VSFTLHTGQVIGADSARIFGDDIMRLVIETYPFSGSSPGSYSYAGAFRMLTCLRASGISIKEV
jgi:hypothetical protein